MNRIKGVIDRHLSGNNDDGKAKSGGSDAKDAINDLPGDLHSNAINDGGQGNGAEQIADLTPENIDSKDSDTDGIDQEKCSECERYFKVIKAKGSINCSVCSLWFCLSCTKADNSVIKNSELKGVLSRADVFWACKTCQPKMHQLLKGPSGEQNKANTTLEAQIENSIREVVPEVVKKCVENLNRDLCQNVSNDMSKLWTSTLFGKDDFPEVDTGIETQKQADRVVAAANRTKPNGMMQGVLKRAFQQHKALEVKHSERQKNLVFFRVPEVVENDFNTRKESDTKKVEEVLQFMGVPDTKPKSVARIGKFIQPAEGESPKSRPLRIEFESAEEAQQVIESCPKLRDAPQNIKTYSIAYDATRDERDYNKVKLAEAKEKSAADPIWDHRVRGPPWQLSLKKYRKRAAPRDN